MVSVVFLYRGCGSELDIRAVEDDLIEKLFSKLVSAYLHNRGIIFDLGRKGYLTAKGFFFKDENAFVSSECVERRGKTRRACANDNYIVHFYIPSLQCNRGKEKISPSPKDL